MKVLVSPFDYARAVGITKQGLYWQIDHGKVQTAYRPKIARFIIADSEKIPTDTPCMPYIEGECLDCTSEEWFDQIPLPFEQDGCKKQSENEQLLEALHLDKKLSPRDKIEILSYYEYLKTKNKK